MRLCLCGESRRRKRAGNENRGNKEDALRDSYSGVFHSDIFCEEEHYRCSAEVFPSWMSREADEASRQRGLLMMPERYSCRVLMSTANLCDLRGFREWRMDGRIPRVVEAETISSSCSMKTFSPTRNLCHRDKRREAKSRHRSLEKKRANNRTSRRRSESGSDSSTTRSGRVAFPAALVSVRFDRFMRFRIWTDGIVIEVKL